MAQLGDAMAKDADWRGGRIWSLVYFAGDDVAALLKDAYSTAFFTICKASVRLIFFSIME